MILEIIQKIIKNVSTDPEVFARACFEKQSFTRMRKMSYTQAIFLLLDLKKTTIQNRLDSFFSFYNQSSRISHQAFSKLRAKFSHLPFETIFRRIVTAVYSEDNSLEKYKDYYLFAVDGSQIRLPYSEELLNEFGTRGSEKNVSAGISVVYDVLNGYALELQISKALRNEKSQFRAHMDYIVNHMPHLISKVVFILDRGYHCADDISKMTEYGFKFVLRCSTSSFKEVCNAPLGDTMAIVAKDQNIRVIKHQTENKELLTLVTNLFDFSDCEIREVYKKRWGIETMYNTLKNTLSIEKVSGKKVNSVLQDIWASFVTLNVVAAFQLEGNKIIEQEHKKKRLNKNKYEYQVSISKLIVTLRENDYFLCLKFPEVSTFKDIFFITKLLSIIASNREPIRAGRLYIRENKFVRRPIVHNKKSTL